VKLLGLIVLGTVASYGADRFIFARSGRRRLYSLAWAAGIWCCVGAVLALILITGAFWLIVGTSALVAFVVVETVILVRARRSVKRRTEDATPMERRPE
jgi:hypothetical protein